MHALLAGRPRLSFSIRRPSSRHSCTDISPESVQTHHTLDSSLINLNSSLGPSHIGPNLLLEFGMFLVCLLFQRGLDALTAAVPMPGGSQRSRDVDVFMFCQFFCLSTGPSEPEQSHGLHRPHLPGASHSWCFIRGAKHSRRRDLLDDVRHFLLFLLPVAVGRASLDCKRRAQKL